MLKGTNILGAQESKKGTATMQAVNAATTEKLPEQFSIATTEEVNTAVEKAIAAFVQYRQITPEKRAQFLETIADEIMTIGDELIERAMLETGLPQPRLIGERGRTTGQLKLFAALLREGSWVEAVIDTAMPDRTPLPRPDLRKMLVPMGPVAVFGASNFPFAFSTAGGDTASALAGGNPVIVKAHDSHLGTNELVGSAIQKAVAKCDLPEGVFSFVIGEGPVTGLQLVKHEGIKAVGFTGSYTAGMSIFKTAATERHTPIPVFAEMSSINPVLLLPEKIAADPNLPAQLAGSITLGAGQFCTNPGLIFLLKDNQTDDFARKLTHALAATPPTTMLNTGISKNYYKGRQMLRTEGAMVLLQGDDLSITNKATPFLTAVAASDFIKNGNLQTELFGPSSMLVICSDKTEMLHALQALHGQLTATVLGTANDLATFAECIDAVTQKVGRVLFSGVPTGVEVGHAMVHGGPFPATTNANSTSVGADAIKRFVRPVCWQDCPADLLPVALQNKNELNIMRKVNGEYTRADV